MVLAGGKDKVLLLIGTQDLRPLPQLSEGEHGILVERDRTVTSHGFATSDEQDLAGEIYVGPSQLLQFDAAAGGLETARTAAQ
jgi:hypothetical protein